MRGAGLWKKRDAKWMPLSSCVFEVSYVKSDLYKNLKSGCLVGITSTSIVCWFFFSHSFHGPSGLGFPSLDLAKDRVPRYQSPRRIRRAYRAGTWRTPQDREEGYHQYLPTGVRLSNRVRKKFPLTKKNEKFDGSSRRYCFSQFSVSF